ncbi:tetratricopeptide repeat-containing sulfotransferase family protein [Schlesneria paludicola]|uniref:tetratricopeptide repeat-containing sulfotransferase family protein n=1 Tax=Schlesneria paludicola TaxID=360056 RepID=UPI00138AC832|nr:sulfotransferase [Schlesneria paludicola]
MHRSRHVRTERWKRCLIVASLRISWKLYRNGQHDLALTILSKLVAFAPQMLFLRIWLARAAMRIGDEALTRKAIQPNEIDELAGIEKYYGRIAVLHLGLEEFAEAMRYLTLAKELSPDSPLTWATYGDLFRLRGDVDESVKHYQAAAARLSHRSSKMRMLAAAATTLSDAGRREAAELYEQIIELEPNDTGAHFCLVESRKNLEMTDPIVSKIRRMTTDCSIPVNHKSNLHFALGLVHSHCGDPGAAMAHWMIANQLRAAATTAPSIDEKAAGVDARCNVFTRKLIDEFSQYGCQDDILICIVGMPRSGTTLTEQILGAHSHIQPLGERTDFWRLTRTLPRMLKTRKGYPECCQRLTPPVIQQTWKSILARIRHVAGNCDRVVTKLPEDVFEIGIIKILFPKTKFINCQRNPVDVGLSCFQQNFRGLDYTMDLENLASVFRLYWRMIRHWNDVLPTGSILNLCYEDLVSAPEASIRNACNFIGVEFQEACLQYHLAPTSVRTGSRWQVRTPIYQTSVNRSEAYREFLGPLIQLESEWTSISTNSNLKTAQTHSPYTG